MDLFDLLTVAEMQEPWRSHVRKGEVSLEEVPLLIKVLAMHKAAKVCHADEIEMAAGVI